MANFYDEQLAYMRHLMDYGVKNESKKSLYTSVMNQKEGADGKVYGIVAEGTKYYIKCCKKGKENLTESFDYIGGFLNRKSCEYSSYADAVKDMDMRLMSLNEDHGKRMPINEMKRSSDFMDNSMLEMQEDIERHRQILENIDVIYQNKKNGIGDRNIGVPEAPKTQEYNTKVGDPFEDKGKYEENRDNKENAKDHVEQGGPFEDEAEYKENTDNMQKKDSNTPGDTYTKKAEYVPDGAVAAMHLSGDKAKKVNESIDEQPGDDWIIPDAGTDEENHDQFNEAGEKFDHHSPEYTGEVPEGPYDSQFGLDFDRAVDSMGEKNEKKHFPEENPDLGAEELGELGDPAEELSPEELEGGEPISVEDLSTDEILSRFNDDPDEPAEKIGTPIAPESDEKAIETLAEPDNNQPAGIDDMSGVDRNNLSADVIDDIVGEMVNRFAKNKRMEMISESVAYSILNEMFDEKEKEKKEREYYHDDDFVYGAPEDRPTPEGDFVSPSPLSQYMDKGSRKPNVGKNGTLDPRKGAPSYVNPDQVEYDPESDYYLQHKFELGLNDDPEADYTESGAWNGTDEKARKYATARVAKAQQELEMIGSELNIDTTKVVDIFRHALYTLQDAKNNLAIMVGIHPSMIEKFLNGNNIPYRNVVSRSEDGEPFGYRDAKDTPQCIITPDGELPKTAEMDDDDYQYVVGPSLKAMGFPDMTTPELRELVDDLLNWDDQYAPLLEAEEDKMRDAIDYVQGLAIHQDAQFARTLNNVVTEWTSLLEDIAGLMSFSALPAEVLNKREEAANMSRGRRGRNISGGYEEYDGSALRNLHEGYDEGRGAYLLGGAYNAGKEDYDEEDLNGEEIANFINCGSDSGPDYDTYKRYRDEYRGLKRDDFDSDAEYHKARASKAAMAADFRPGLLGKADRAMVIGAHKLGRGVGKVKDFLKGTADGAKDFAHNKIGLEEETTVLHNFGDHPGYRKKPFSTPANVEVAPNGARDWNDESTKGEEPFGKQIGSSAPYDEIVDAVTREVLKHLQGGQN